MKEIFNQKKKKLSAANITKMAKECKKRLILKCHTIFDHDQIFMSATGCGCFKDFKSGMERHR